MNRIKMKAEAKMTSVEIYMQKFMDNFEAIESLCTLDLSNLDKSFKCLICNKRFTTETTVHRHIENYHVEEWVKNRDQIILNRVN